MYCARGSHFLVPPPPPRCGRQSLICDHIKFMQRLLEGGSLAKTELNCLPSKTNVGPFHKFSEVILY